MVVLSVGLEIVVSGLGPGIWALGGTLRVWAATEAEPEHNTLFYVVEGTAVTRHPKL